MKNPPKTLGILRSETNLRRIYLGGGAIAILILFWKLQFSTDAICCGDFDGYYHIKWSRMLWEGLRHRNFPPIFPWLQLTTLNPNNYVDHHFLFHIFQIPFTFGDLRVGAKIASIFFATMAVVCCYWLMLQYRIRYVLVWLVALLACSAPFLYRMNMAKAPPFAIIYLVLGIFFLFKKKYWPLIPLAFLFTLTYDAFLLMVLAAVIWVAVIGWTERRFEWRPLVCVLLGVAAGLVINPYFPQNLRLHYEHLSMKLTPSDYSTKVGQEWYPYNSWEFVGNSLVACVAMVLGYVAFDPSDRKRAHHPLFFLIFATVLMIMTARWKRIAEYWPPFAVMFSAFALQPWFVGTRDALTRLPTDLLDELEPYFDRNEPEPPVQPDERREVWRTVAAAVVAIVLGVVLWFNLSTTIDDIAASEPHDYYMEGAEWMRANVPAPQIIFNTDWDDFPRLFYYDPTHNYVSGLDPTYLFDKDPKLSQLYERITLGEEEDPGPLIRGSFGASYVFTDNRHDNFYHNAIESGWFDIVYEDTDCTILRIREVKGSPPLEELQPGDLPDDEPLPNEEP